MTTDELLHLLAENITEEGLKYRGAEFTYNDTGELFQLVVCRESALPKLTSRVSQLENMLTAVLDDLECYDSLPAYRVVKIRELLDQRSSREPTR